MLPTPHLFLVPTFIVPGDTHLQDSGLQRDLLGCQHWDISKWILLLVVCILYHNCTRTSNLTKLISTSYIFLDAPVITLLERNYSSQFTITCISTTSPATTVIWMKDGNNLAMDGAYQLTQVMTNRRSSIYNNILTSIGHPDTFPGNYTCAVYNTLGNSTESIEIQG